MKHIFTAALLACLALTAHAETIYKDEENDNEVFSVSAGARVFIALLYLALTAGAGVVTYIFFKSSNKLKFCSLAIALYGIFRAIIGFIPDSKFEGKKGICSLFLELFPGFFYLSAFFVFFEEFGSYLSTKRTEPHGLSTTNLGLFGTVKEIIRKIPSLSGVLLVASVLVAILFCILGVAVGGNVEPINYHIYFTYNNAILTSGILLVMLVVFGIIYPRKRVFVGGCMVYPFVRLILSFVCVLRTTRLGAESRSGVNAAYIILSLAMEVLPMVLVLVSCIPLSRMCRRAAQDAQNVPSESFGKSSFFNGIGFALSDDETRLDADGNSTGVQGSSIL